MHWLSKLSFLVILFLIGKHIKAVNGTRCDDVVHIESTELLSYLGIISFAAPVAFSGNWTLELETTVPYAFIGGWGVWVSGLSDSQAIFHNKDPVKMQAGDVISFRFRIHYNTRGRLPFVKTLKWEKWTICQITGLKKRTGYFVAEDPVVVYNISNFQGTSEEEPLSAVAGGSLANKIHRVSVGGSSGNSVEWDSDSSESEEINFIPMSTSTSTSTTVGPSSTQSNALRRRRRRKELQF